MTLLNPTLEAGSMEVMSIVTMQLRYHIAFLVLHQTYYALGLVREHLRIVLSFAQGS